MPEMKCGLEIHVPIKVERKLFCNCSTANDEPNTNICETCTAQPGAKPMRANKEAFEKALKCALLLNCTIRPLVLFQRKHYDWPDLPSGYQRTMSGTYAPALGQNGELGGIGIEGIHLEEDPARWNPETGIVDYNRCGRPLIELVTKPDFRSPQQVREWLPLLIAVLRSIDAIDEESGIKADVNVSIEPAFHRVEIKNINSFKSIALAIEYEVARQERELKEGKVISLHTRQWHDETGRTVFMREKESAQDYMFIPDPDLPSIKITSEDIEKYKKTLPERPDALAMRFVKDKGVSEDDARIISAHPELTELLVAVSKNADANTAAKFIRTEVLRVLNHAKKPLSKTHITEKQVSDILALIEEGTLTDVAARRTLEAAAKETISVRAYITSEGLEAKEHDLDGLAKKLIDEHPQVVADFKSGKEQALNFLVGRIMRELKGTVDAKAAKEALMRAVQ